LPLSTIHCQDCRLAPLPFPTLAFRFLAIRRKSRNAGSQTNHFRCAPPSKVNQTLASTFSSDYPAARAAAQTRAARHPAPTPRRPVWQADSQHPPQVVQVFQPGPRTPDNHPDRQLTLRLAVPAATMRPAMSAPEWAEIRSMNDESRFVVHMVAEMIGAWQDGEEVR
jgi:hypothetical protein